MKPSGVDRGVALIDGAAEIGVGAELAALLGARHHVGLDLETLGLRSQPPRQGVVLGRVMRGMEAADHAEIAVDLLGGDEISDPGQRVLALPADAKRGFRAVSSRELVIARLDARRDLPAIARAASEAGVFCVDHQRVAAAARGLQRGAEPGIARADNDDIGGRRRRGLLQRRPGHMVPPIGRELEIRGEERVGHAVRLRGVDARASRSTRSAPFSPTMMVGALVLPDVTAGKTEASMTRNP